jgi:HEPN domain-containing protein
MPRRHKDWLAQAKQDLEAAKDSFATNHYEWSAFQAQRAAGKAAKALLRFHNHEMAGHTILHLLSKAREFTAVPEEYFIAARELDRHYIQPRYPNAFAAGYPAEFYDEETVRRCIDHAEKIIQFVEEHIS